MSTTKGRCGCRKCTSPSFTFFRMRWNASSTRRRAMSPRSPDAADDASRTRRLSREPFIDRAQVADHRAPREVLLDERAALGGDVVQWAGQGGFERCAQAARIGRDLDGCAAPECRGKVATPCHEDRQAIRPRL